MQAQLNVKPFGHQKTKRKKVKKQLNVREKMAKRKNKKMKNPCWKGYEAIGMKKKGGRKVPNCVPIKKKK